MRLATVHQMRAAATGGVTSARRACRVAAVCVIALLSAAPVAAQLAPAFTYQGRLEDGGQPKNGLVDLRFTAFNVESGGTQIAVERVLDAVPVVAGLFTVKVDLGPGVFLGDPIFVEVAVREDAVGDATVTTGFTALSPRQEITPAPYALHAERVAFDSITGSQVANGTIGTFDIADGSLTANDVNTTSTTTGLQRRVTAGCPAGQALQNITAAGAPVCYQPVTSVVAAPGSGLTASNAGGVVTLELNPFEGQLQVEGTCDVIEPAAIRQVHSDGSVSCVYLGAAVPRAPVTLDAAGDVGSHLSMQRGSALGTTVVSVAYYDDSNNRLKYIRCTTPTCDPLPTPVIIDDPATNDVGQFVSLAARNGTLMAYYDATADDLKLAFCSPSDCTTPPTIRTIDTGGGGDVGRFAEIVLLQNGYGIAYFDATNNRYKWASCNDSACTSPQTRDLGISGGGVLASDIAAPRMANASDLSPSPVFIVLRGGSEAVRVACDDTSCTTFSTKIVASGDVGPPLSMTSNNFAGQIQVWVGFGRPSAGNDGIVFCEEATCSNPAAVNGSNRGAGAVVGTVFTPRPEGSPMLFKTTLTTPTITARRFGSLRFVEAAYALDSTTTASGAIDASKMSGSVEQGIVYFESNTRDLVYQACERSDCSEL